MRTLDRTAPELRRPLRRTPLDFAGLFAGLLLLALTALVVGWQFWHANRIFTGVNIAGVPVGGMTRAAAAAELERTFPTAPAPSIRLTSGDREWVLPADGTRLRADWREAVNRAYLVGRQGGPAVGLGGQLAAALAGVDLAAQSQPDVAALRSAISRVADEVRRPPRPAVSIGEITLPAEPGIDVDVDAVLKTLLEEMNGADGGAISLPLPLIPLPAETLGAPAAAPPNYELPAPQPLVLTNARYNQQIALDERQLDRLLFTRTPLRLDEDAARGLLNELAAGVNVPPRDARLRFDPLTGGIGVLQPSRPGRMLDVEATLASLTAALAAGTSTADLVLVEAPPKVDMNRIPEMGIREWVAGGTTTFAGSSAERVRNVEVAAEKFDGVVIPPGEVFSFNEVVEDVSSANGFEDSLVIWGDRTAVGVGGGVCQVSTTLFRAAYAAGLPIVERYNHGYVVDWYGEPGLDATIYTPSVDLRFRNDTAAYLLIQPQLDTANGVITFDLYGTRPARDVTISDPVISDVQKPEPPAYVVDESLEAGERKQVDWAKDGMTAKVTRTIVENGASRTDTLVSHYQPWKAIYLVGPGTPIPDSPPQEE